MQGRLILVGDVPNMKELAEVLGCKVGVLPNAYLGLPLGAPYKSSTVWEGVEERFKKGLLCGRDSISQKVEDKH